MEIKDYKNVYVFAEQRDGEIQSVAYELLGKARDLADALGEKVVAILAGYGVKDITNESYSQPRSSRAKVALSCSRMSKI